MLKEKNEPEQGLINDDPIEGNELGAVRNAFLAARDCKTSPGAGFTERVTVNLPRQSPTLLSGMLEELTRPGRFGSNSIRLLSGGGTRREFALLLTLAGLFHLFLALLMILGLDRLGAAASGQGWLSFQPAFLAMIGLWLFVVSLTVWRGGKREMKKAGSVLWAYLIALLINVGWMAMGPGRVDIGRPYLGLVIGIAGFGLLLVACRPEVNAGAMKTGEAS